ncbi:MAG: PDDEXK nuclease domain-containing protein [Deltaproteobacteria bacterium]|nr:PDDEXK nuclease domain-containing protein [Deltaproteobacteria bacterium]
MSSDLIIDKEYKAWLSDIKLKIRNVQIKAALKVQTELLNFYWELGADIVAKQTQARWGDGLVEQLSKDLMAEFPEIKGFSRSNLKYIKKWYLFYRQDHTKGQQPVGQIQEVEKSQQVVGQTGQQAIPQITQIPWGHNIAIITKCKNIDEALYYVQCTLAHNWSRSVLVHQIESGLYKREGKAVTNFALTLPKPQSDLAVQTLKDPYVFDFLTMTKDYNERDLENALVSHVRQFLLELGAGFAYMGKQIALQVGEREFFIDLLFYHTKLHCYVVVELKVVDFEPEHAGKLNFYLKAIDSQLRTDRDQPTIGILICKKKDKIVAEYALSDINKSIGVSEYRLTESIPDTFKGSLPTIEQIEAELGGERG